MNPRPPALAPSLSLHGWRYGFTLVELMIAIAIGLVMLVALLTLFINTSRSNTEIAKMNSLIDNGRFAMQLLESDIAHAGFWGTYLPPFDDLNATTTPGDVPSAVPNPCLTYPTDGTNSWDDPYKHNLIGIPLQGYEYEDEHGAHPPICAAVIESPDGTIRPLPHTDLLVVRHAESCVPGVGACEADTTGKLYFQSSLCSTDTDPYILNTTGYTLKKGDCTAVAEKRKFISNIYYIRLGPTTEENGTPIPTLVRSEFDLANGVLAHQTAVPLIEGIEGFRVELGIDNKSKTGYDIDYTNNRADGSPDVFVRCTTAAPCNDPLQMMNVTAAKLYVLARAREITPGYTDTKTYTLGSTTLGPFDDGYKRHLFSTTVRLTNVSVRREAP